MRRGMVAVTGADAWSPESGRWWKSVAEEREPVDLRTGEPHPARIYDYALGGKDNFPADREAAEKAFEAYPSSVTTARQNREFMVRAARFLVGEAGIRQFLDIGTGIPTSPNLHEVVQGIAPDARVVYADNDPIVLAHARALLTSSPQGATAYLDADLRDTDRILASPELLGTLDLTRPVALSLIAIFHFIPDSDDPYGIVRRIMDKLPTGSYLMLTNLTADFDPAVRELEETYRQRGLPLHTRSQAEVERFFDGLELVDPGVRAVHRWRPAGGADPGLTDAAVGVLGGVAVKR